MTGYASPAKTASLGQAKAWTRGLLRCGLAAGPAFVTAFAVEGGARDGYRPLRHPVSSLALGPRGWAQTGNFAATGMLFLAAAAGLARAGDPAASRLPVPALIGAAGAGLIGAAIFPTDPVSGYPPGTPGALPAPNVVGRLPSPCAKQSSEVSSNIVQPAPEGKAETLPGWPLDGVSRSTQ